MCFGTSWCGSRTLGSSLDACCRPSPPCPMSPAAQAPTTTPGYFARIVLLSALCHRLGSNA
eukprot:5640450-Amphidinium_carterae.1